MKKQIRKVLAYLAVVSMVFTLVAPSCVAEAKEKKRTTEIHIQKLHSDIGFGENFPMNHDGSKIDNLEELDIQAKGLNGVTFAYFKVRENQYKMLLDAMNNEHDLKPNTYGGVQSVLKNQEIEYKILDPTKTVEEEDGIATVTLEDGYYWFIEKDYPENVSKMLAVPFGLSLPMTNKDRTGYMSDLYIYPKNVTGKLPKIDKDVTTVGNKETSYDVDEKIPWIIRADVPNQLKNYSKYSIEDTLDPRLTPSSDANNPRIYMLKKSDIKDGMTPKDLYDKALSFKEDEKNLIELSVFSSEQWRTNESYGYILKLYTDSTVLPDLAIENPNVEYQFVVIIDSVIDASKIKPEDMGQDIYNDVSLKYKNNPYVDDDEDEYKKETPEEKPRVWTGGKRFLKTDATQDDKVLQGAEFVVKNANGEYLTEDMTWTKEQQALKTFKSDENGIIDIKGLAGKSELTGETDSQGHKIYKDVPVKYYLKEVKAAKDYALLEKPIEFEISRTSYNQKVEEGEAITLTPVDPTVVKNKKITIPQTGGIGALIIVLAGCAIMLAAHKGLKKKE